MSLAEKVGKGGRVRGEIDVREMAKCIQGRLEYLGFDGPTVEHDVLHAGCVVSLDGSDELITFLDHVLNKMEDNDWYDFDPPWQLIDINTVMIPYKYVQAVFEAIVFYPLGYDVSLRSVR